MSESPGDFKSECLGGFVGIGSLMHRNVTHNRCYANFTDFSTTILTFLRDEVPSNWRRYCDQVSDNFRVIGPANFRVRA